MVFSALIGTVNEEVVRVVSEGEWRLSRLDIPGNMPIFDPPVAEDFQRRDSVSDRDVFKVSPLNIRLGGIKRGLIGIVTDSLLLFCFESL